MCNENEKGKKLYDEKGRFYGVSYIMPKKSILEELEQLAVSLRIDVAAENLRIAISSDISQDRIDGKELEEKIKAVYKLQEKLNEAVGEIIDYVAGEEIFNSHQEEDFE